MEYVPSLRPLCAEFIFLFFLLSSSVFLLFTSTLITLYLYLYICVLHKREYLTSAGLYIFSALKHHDIVVRLFAAIAGSHTSGLICDRFSLVYVVSAVCAEFTSFPCAASHKTWYSGA
ncbi:hypothetical protein KC19_4G044700 [Ceratodon purpureus]|uniref:Uncharacterized protein n=1 Tax=Ceratodon purpureus TaxID=3225 RepID=A0A8T0I6J1_CERPU|nr:hypothetical protein KC19_4G044700 [Ceratodon purpureus]